MADKPRIFIGSSVEALKIAHAIQDNLQYDALCKVWAQGFFNLSETSLTSLLKHIREYDYSIFVLKADDILEIRNERYNVVRDNIIFEMGLFIGNLGINRVFYVIPKESEKLHLPTDLVGITSGYYEEPDNDSDLQAALGPFCNKVRNQIRSMLKDVCDVIEEPSNVTNKGKCLTLIENNDNKLQEIKTENKGDGDGQLKISMTPSQFWDGRICSAFPGLSGLVVIDDVNKCINRLEILLKEPLRFDISSAQSNYSTTPIWWLRGGKDNPITSFRRLDESHCLMDSIELNIAKIAVYRSSAYYRSFVYVEVKADRQTGLRAYTEKEIEDMVSNFGFAYEEYAIHKENIISRECFDDGAAEIDGEIVDTHGAKPRIRYLTKYNFIIAPHFSPINSVEFDSELKGMLNDLLVGAHDLGDLCFMTEGIPKNKLDY